MKNRPKTVTFTDTEIKIVERLIRSGTNKGLGIADLIGGEYSDYLEGMNDSQKLQFLVKIERIGIL